MLRLVKHIGEEETIAVLTKDVAKINDDIKKLEKMREDMSVMIHDLEEIVNADAKKGA